MVQISSDTPLTQYRQQLQQLLSPVCYSTEQAQAESWLLLEHVLEQPKTKILMQNQSTLSPEQHAALVKMLNQRIKQRVPIQHLLGKAWFYGHCFSVSPAVLIPRPETELLVKLAIDYITNTSKYLHIVDLGTGSGCIAISVALRAPHATITAIDISPEALVIAQANAMQLQAPSITFQHDDGLTNITDQSIDLLVSNPPYISRHNITTLSPEVASHEPHLALFADDDGLAMYHHIATEGNRALKPKGKVMVEFGDNPTGVKQIFKTAGYTNIQIYPDYAGLPRLLTATSP